MEELSEAERLTRANSTRARPITLPLLVSLLELIIYIVDDAVNWQQISDSVSVTSID